MAKNSDLGPTPFSPCSFDYYPGTPNRRSVHSSSFAFRGPTRPLPREPNFDFGPDNLGSDTEDEGTDEESEPFGRNLQLNLHASKQSLNVLRNNRGRPNEAVKEPHWKKLSFSQKISKLIRRFPFVHAIAFLFCFPFGILFAVESHFSFDTLLVTLQEVMHMSYYGMETVEIVSTAFGCLIASLSALIFLAAIVSAYHGITSDGTSIASPTPPLILLVILYPAAPIWCFLLAVSLTATMGSMLLEGVCATDEISEIWHRPGIETSGSACKLVSDNHSSSHCVECIDLYPYHFIFPSGVRREDMEICGREVWLLCTADLPEIVFGTQLCTLSAGIIILGVGLHLLALSYNRAELGERQKRKELRDLAYIRNRVQSVLQRNSVDTSAFFDDQRK